MATRRDDDRQRIAPYHDELVTYHGQSIVPRLVVFRGQLWYRKPYGAWPETLAFRLGGSWLNVAKVVTGSEVSLVTTRDGQPSPTDASTILIRIGQDCSPDELPVQDLDEAIASELVFSLWIRRRDAHAWNRAYVDGVPIFFDSHIAFGAEPNHVPLDGFFELGGDDGYAGRWRARTLGPGEVPTTKGERALPRGSAAHRVRDLARFDRLLDVATKRIGAFTDAELLTAAQGSGVTAATQVAALLGRTRDELGGEGIRRLRSVLYKP